MPISATTFSAGLERNGRPGVSWTYAGTSPVRVIFESQPEGGFTAYVPDLPGCVSEGRTLEEATEMIRDAMAGYLASLKDRGQTVPQVEHRKLEPA